MVEFKCTFDKSRLQKLNKHTFVQSKIIYFASLFLALLGVLYLFKKDYLQAGLFFAIAVITVPILKIIVKKSEKDTADSMYVMSAETTEIYRFTMDGIYIETQKGEDYHAVTQAKYNYIFKVDETSDCYYLFISKVQCHVLDKACLTQGSFDELNDLFIKNLGVKFNALKK